MSELTSSLLSATGSDYGMLSTNPALNLTGLYHMYVTGMTSLFNYGDHGPNKYSTTANSMIFLGNQYREPRYMLHQRDRIDAPEPNAVFWYDPTVSGIYSFTYLLGLSGDFAVDDVLITFAPLRCFLGWHAARSLFR